MASSSFATISEAQLDELVENKYAKNRKIATLSAGRIFEAYLREMAKRNRKPRQKSAMC